MRRQLARIAITLSVSLATPVVPAAGQATTYGYDANGNVVSKLEDGVAWTYVYDTRNLLVEVQRDGLLVETYQYDYRGHRIRKAGPDGVVRYVWDGDRILLETDDFGNTIAKYEYADDRLLAIRHESEGTAFYLFDALGSPVALSELDGSLAARYSYDAWGAIRRTVGASANEFLFTAYQFDEATGLYYAKARFYDPEIGRFLSQDPLPGGPSEPPSLHPHLYARANPTTYIDPDGRCATKEARQSEFCQAIARGMAWFIGGDPEADADRQIAIRDKVVEGRRRFRAETGRDPQPDDVVWSDGQRALTSGFGEIDMTGRIEPARTEWTVVGAGIGTRLAINAARASGATAAEQIAAGVSQLGDEALGEITGISPGDIAALARTAKNRLEPRSAPSSSSTPGATIVGEATNRPGADLLPAPGARPTSVSELDSQRSASSTSGTVPTPWGTRDLATGKFTTGPRGGVDPVDDFIAHAEANGFQLVGREVTFKTPFGNRRADVLLMDPRTGRISGFEVKSSVQEFNRFNPAQFAADRYINRFGANATGEKAVELGVSELDNMTKILWEPSTPLPSPTP